MSEIKERFTSDGINTIYKSNEKYSAGTMKVSVITDQGELSVSFTELGEGYIQLNSVEPLGKIIILTYELFGTLPEDNQEEYNIKERIKTLEKAVENLYTLNKQLEKALEQRVNITSFQAWLRLVEKKLGIKLIDKTLGNINQSLYQDE